MCFGLRNRPPSKVGSRDSATASEQAAKESGSNARVGDVVRENKAEKTVIGVAGELEASLPSPVVDIADWLSSLSWRPEACTWTRGIASPSDSECSSTVEGSAGTGNVKQRALRLGNWSGVGGPLGASTRSMLSVSTTRPLVELLLRSRRSAWRASFASCLPKQASGVLVDDEALLEPESGLLRRGLSSPTGAAAQSNGCSFKLESGNLDGFGCAWGMSPC